MMPRDYAVQHNAQTPKPHKPKKRFPWIVVLLVLLVIGLISFRVYQHTQKKTAKTATALTQKKTATTVTTQTSTKTKNTPEFSFYTMLPNMKVDVTEIPPPPPPPLSKTPTLEQGDTNNVPDENPAKTQLDSMNKEYYLQLGSFNHPEEAEKLKQQLTSEGFNVTIRTVQSPDHQPLSRVWVGPFPNLHKAEENQRALQKKFHPSILLSMQ